MQYLYVQSYFASQGSIENDIFYSIMKNKNTSQ